MMPEPPEVRELVPNNHLVFFIIEVLERLDVPATHSNERVATTAILLGGETTASHRSGFRHARLRVRFSALLAAQPGRSGAGWTRATRATQQGTSHRKTPSIRLRRDLLKERK